MGHHGSNGSGCGTAPPQGLRSESMAFLERGIVIAEWAATCSSVRATRASRSFIMAAEPRKLTLSELRTIVSSPMIEPDHAMGISRIKLTAFSKEGKLEDHAVPTGDDTPSRGPGAECHRLSRADPSTPCRIVVGRHVPFSKSSVASGNEKNCLGPCHCCRGSTLNLD